MTLTTLHVVVTCTDRKTRPVADELRARTLPLDSLDARLGVWTQRLDSARGDRITADRLYAGDHWQVVRSLGTSGPPNIEVRTWICSAGYGLVSLQSQILPYAATFTSAHPDAVAPHTANYTTSEWWQSLASWRPDDAPGPRTVSCLARLVADSPSDFLLVAISGEYAAALSLDLAEASQIVRAARAEDRLAITATSAMPIKTLGDHLVPVSARLKSNLGGAMQSLNARAARQAVREAASWFPSRSALALLSQSWIAAAPESKSYDRTQLGDDEVRDFIRSRLDAEPQMTKTRLLRALRDGGRACEQSRFGALFREVKLVMHQEFVTTSAGAPEEAAR